MKKSTNKNEKIKIQKTYLALKIQIFFFVLLIIAVIGLLIPLRPKESTVEKRELEKFPAFTVASFLDGSYFNQISTWYADTFPFRETLLSANSSIKNLYGIQGEQIVSKSGKTGDEIPEGGMMVTDTDETKGSETKGSDETAESGETGTAQTEQTETQEETLPDGTIHTVPEVSGDVYVSGDRAFGIYYFDREGANAYINMIDKAQKRLDGIADVYTILAPTSVGVSLDENAQEKIGSSDQKKSIEYIYSNINNMNNKVKTVDIFDTLKKHNSEYIYFRTDHHWTALGAYYAYQQFCAAKGITATPIDTYEKVEFPNFVGSFYASSGQAASLKSNPDTVIAYKPTSTNDMMYVDKNLQEIQWRVIFDVSDYQSGVKYSTFVAGDEIYAKIDNPTLTDGSACVVIKESYGNAFIPFLVDHYQHVYIVDYRYFYKYPQYGNSVYRLVTENNVKDVIFVNNADAMTNKSQINSMSAMFD